MPQQIVLDLRQGVGGGTDRPEGCRHRADAAVDLAVGGQELEQQIGETVRVGEPFGEPPIRLVRTSSFTRVP